jgi:hypothetical protein
MSLQTESKCVRCADCAHSTTAETLPTGYCLLLCEFRHRTLLRECDWHSPAMRSFSDDAPRADPLNQPDQAGDGLSYYGLW